MQGSKRNSFRVSRERRMINPWGTFVVEEMTQRSEIASEYGPVGHPHENANASAERRSDAAARRRSSG
ncbi:hypothetical protein SAMN05421819_0792 [Bryocella elongata]|uniref:Uncharacterized protein n=1 Tax=Bryocella elongata TaxID=863522 RepID=A0A1H5TYG3_9BACT|nr:hypothetical protein SAMN05421819_0792 [Bryocella elongata]